MHYCNLLIKCHESFEHNESAIGLFTNLSKAFDTIDHNILLKKLEIYGISGKHLQWFQNYLSNSKRYVQFDGGQKTNFKAMKCVIRKDTF